MIFYKDSSDHIKERVVNSALKAGTITFREIAESYMYIDKGHRVVVNVPNHILLMMADKSWMLKYELENYLEDEGE